MLYDPAVFTHVNLVDAQRRSAEVILWAREHFSEKKYAAVNRRLSVEWIDSWGFNAYAGRYVNDPYHDYIRITFGVQIALHHDAETFLQWVEREIGNPDLDEIFAMIDLPKLRGLPSDLGFSDAVDRMFRMTMAWLYLHEQAHLFQGHYDLTRSAGVEARIEEFAGRGDEPLEGTEAAVRQVCELSADHEATVLAMQLLIVADDQAIRPGTLWLFFAGLTCMFQRFYGHGEREIGGEAHGSHPPPSYRLWLTQKLIVDFVMHPKVVGRAKGVEDAAHVHSVLEHAKISATMYWNAHYKIGQPVNDFLNGTGGLKPIDKAYQRQIFSTWSVLRPKVVAAHFGWGEDSILTLDSADVLGATRNDGAPEARTNHDRP